MKRLKFNIIAVITILFSIGMTRFAFAVPDGTGQEIFNTGNVGIGTTTPQTGLAVTSGNVGIGTWTAAGGSLIVKTGNVGVGTIWPGAALDVNGTVRATSFVGSGVGLTGVLAFPAGNLNAVQYGDGISTLGDETRFSFNGTNVGIGTTNGVAMLDVRGGVYTTGNVGVGSTAPGTALDVQGTTRTTGLQLSTSPAAGYVLVSGSTGIGTWMAPGTITTAVTAGGSFSQLQYNNGGSFDGIVNSNVTASGNIGFGTTLSANKLDVSGGVGIGTAYAGYAAAPANGMIVQGNVGLGTIIPSGGLVVMNGNVGIGTWKPAALFQVKNVYIPAGGSGNLGIGVASPSALLDMYSTTANSTPILVKGPNSTGIRILGETYPQGGGSLIGSDVDSGHILLTTNLNPNLTQITGAAPSWAAVLSGVSDTFTIQRRPASGAGLATLLSLNSIGNLGVGTTLSANRLDIQGGVGIGTSYAGYTSAPSNGLIVEGNVGVGSTAPGAKVDVNGTVRATSFVGSGVGLTGVLAFPAGGLNAVQYGDGLSTLGDESKFSFDGTNVGVGTSNGVAKLDVRGGVYTLGNIGVGSTAPGTALDVQGTTRTTGLQLSTSPAAGYVLVSGSTGIGTWMAPGTITTAVTAGGSSTQLQYNNGGSFDGIVNSNVTASGNIGFGTTLSANKLDVSGGVGIGTSYAGYKTAPSDGLIVEGNVGLGTFQTTAGKVVVGGVSNGAVAQTWLRSGSSLPGFSMIMYTNGGQMVGYNNGTADFLLQAGGTSFMAVTSGNLGIGTSDSQSKFSVVGGNVGIGTWTAAGGNLIVNGGGNVGVGTAWPGTAVDVNGTVRATSFVGSGVGLTGVLAFPAGGLNAVQYGDGLSTLGDESKLSFDGTNVGIGTSNGVAKLDVRGGVYASGNVGLGTTTPQGSLVVTNGNVGIGTWAPAVSLDIPKGNVGVGTFIINHSLMEITGNGEKELLRVNDSGPNDKSPFVVNATGSIGIGTTQADAQLTILGSGTTTSTATSGYSAYFQRSSFAGEGVNVALVSGTLGTASLGFGDTGGAIMGGVVYNNQTDTLSFRSNNVADRLTINSSGNVGIGTTTPQSKFAIVGGNIGVGTWTADSASLETTGLRLIGNGASAGSVLVSSSTGIGTWMAPGTISTTVSVGGATKAVQYNNAGSLAGNEANFAFDGTNVGIGTTTPQAAFGVAGGNVGIGTWTADGGNLIVNGGGNVGIGSAWPGKMLDVLGDARISGNVDIDLQ